MKTPGATSQPLHTDAEVEALQKAIVENPAGHHKLLRDFALEGLLRASQRPTTTGVAALRILLNYAEGANRKQGLAAAASGAAQATRQSVLGKAARDAVKAKAAS